MPRMVEWDDLAPDVQGLIINDIEKHLTNEDD